jgi:hypothetical protein
MTVDPTHPDTIDEDTGSGGSAGEGGRNEVSAEAPEADTAEQRADLAPPEDTEQAVAPDSANEADLAEQARVVDLDEDDYR